MLNKMKYLKNTVVLITLLIFFVGTEICVVFTTNIILYIEIINYKVGF